MFTLDGLKIAVIGLGYVGLPLAVEFAKMREVVGFDIDSTRIQELMTFQDRTHELDPEDLAAAKGLRLTNTTAELRECNCFIITVPTPIDVHKTPDLAPLLTASEMVGRFLKTDSIVIYESTVYPGATEEDCVPMLEEASGLTLNHDFFVGYSPERINPGDNARKLPDIMKVTSGSTPEIAELVDGLYRQIIVAGTHKAESIRIAEASKVIENTQRDLNIALINEFAMIFNKMGIETEAVLRAAGTKWNFLNFRPGLVGGHCIGVDPYYLTHKAAATGYHPDIILASRRLNDGMGSYVVDQLIRGMIQRGIAVARSRILILGLTFKENCPDLRNTRVVDIVGLLKTYNCDVDIFDPLASADAAKKEHSLDLVSEPRKRAYDAIIITVAHSVFANMGVPRIRAFGKDKHILYDLKYLFKADETDMRL